MIDLAKITAVMAKAPTQMQRITSYADALTTAIIRSGDLKIGTDPARPAEGPHLVFRRDENVHDVDFVSSGRHTLVYEMVGLGKKYRVMIEPIQETHK